MTTVYLKHQTLFQDLFVKSQCFVWSEFQPWCFGDTKNRKLIFIPKKQWLLYFSLFYIRLLNFIWFDQHCYDLYFVENSLCWKLVEFLYRSKHLTKFFVKSFTTTPKPITVPSMPWVPNTIHAVVLSRVCNMELENRKPCFICIRVKVMRNTRLRIPETLINDHIKTR